MRSLLVVLVLAVPLISTAEADSTSSETLAGEAKTLADQGDFVGAAAKFRAAYAADPKPELMCNVGVAYYKGKDFPRAARFLAQCVASGSTLDPAFLSTVNQVQAAVDAKLKADDFTPIDLVVEPATAATVVAYGGHAEEPLVGSRRAWVPYGHYKLTIHAEGFDDKVIEGDAASHDAIAVSAKLEPAKVVVVTPPHDNALDVKPHPVAPPPPAAPSKTPAIIATVVAGLGGIGAGVSFALASGKATDAGKATNVDAYNKLVSSTRTYQHASWIAGGIGGVAAIAAGYLWFRALHSSEVTVAPAEHGTGAAVVFTRSF